MAHGGYGKRKVAGRPPLSRGSGSSRGWGRGPGVRKETDKKSKIVSTKNQIRSIERLLKKVLPAEVKDAQQKRLEELKKQSELHARIELERKMALRYRKVKFFERRKIERRIRRLEKQQRGLLDHASDDNTEQLANLTEQLAQLKEDLEYVRFFPKTEKYVSLFMGNEDEQVVAKRGDLREKIKANLAAATAAGVDLEETGSEDEAMDMSEDDFFMAGSSSDDADDEWTDKSPRLGEDKDDTSKELVPLNQPLRSSLSKASKRTLTTRKNQSEKSARVLMPPPGPKRQGPSSSRNPRVGKFSNSRTPSSSSAGETGKRVRYNQHSSSNGEGETGKRVRYNQRSSSNGEGETRKRVRYNQRSSSNGEEVTRARSQRSNSTVSWENVKSSASDTQQSKPKRKRSRPKKKKT